MKYRLTQPMTVGDLTNPILIDELELASVAVNFEPEWASQGKATLSVVLVHLASGYKTNIVYRDATALTFWRNLNLADKVTSAILNKLQTDGKLPPGSITS